MTRRLSLAVTAAATAVALSAPAFVAGTATAHGSVMRGSGGIVGADIAVPFWCGVTTTEVAASTSVDECRLYADDVLVAKAERVVLSGQAAVTAGAATVAPATSRLTVCWSGRTDPVLGGHAEYAQGCSTTTR